MCAAGYGFLSAYAIKAWQQERLSARHNQLRMIKLQHQELVRKTEILDRASRFTARAQELGLHPDGWTLYDVNVQSPLEFDAAHEIVYLCGDSSLAYYWPISLEIKKQESGHQGNGGSKSVVDNPADLLLSVKGRFAARR